MDSVDAGSDHHMISETPEFGNTININIGRVYGRGRTEWLNGMNFRKPDINLLITALMNRHFEVHTTTFSLLYPCQLTYMDSTDRAQKIAAGSDILDEMRS